MNGEVETTFSGCEWFFHQSVIIYLFSDDDNSTASFVCQDRSQQYFQYSTLPPQILLCSLGWILENYAKKIEHMLLLVKKFSQSHWHHKKLQTDCLSKFLHMKYYENFEQLAILFSDITSLKDRILW